MSTRFARYQRTKRAQELARHKDLVADERGWAGQHGQCPASEEEAKYRPHEQQAKPHAPSH